MNLGLRYRKERPFKKWGIGILILFLFSLMIWLAGLFWFVHNVPETPTYNPLKTDSIIVLTGGSGRLEVGLDLLSKGYANYLFISGVARGVDVKELLKLVSRKPNEFACCIAIGYRADNTAGNAIETSIWMSKSQLKSLRLVTANYHMPRSLLEFRRAMPKIQIVPHPVFPPQFKRKDWWQWPGTAELLASEFNKYIIAQFGLKNNLPTEKNKL
ncbi:MAG: hypothetical protein CMM83_01660 [Rhodospirillales bacterium]|nr:hypothetical protein [Rhodospirillales bacterium]|tara:strand:+ start:5969 stop:6610 length:642 start_codon:yes stop_codon:yes gene_type:complete